MLIQNNYDKEKIARKKIIIFHNKYLTNQIMVI